MEVQDCPLWSLGQVLEHPLEPAPHLVAAEATGADYRWPAWRQPDQSRWRRCDRSQLPAPRHCREHGSNFVLNLQSNATNLRPSEGSCHAPATNGPGAGERCDLRSEEHTSELQ